MSYLVAGHLFSAQNKFELAQNESDQIKDWCSDNFYLELWSSELNFVLSTAKSWNSTQKEVSSS